MAFLTMSYTFANTTAANATEVNTNFQDIIDATSDGTIDFNIAALTAAGTATFNGNVLLGNASGDDVQFNGSLATSITIKTANTYNIGAAGTGLAGLYINCGASNTVRLVGSSSGTPANWTFTFPSTAGVAGQALVNSGSGTMVWAPNQYDIHAVSSADYTITDSDGYRFVNVTAGASTRTITLPTAADNTDRVITIKKMDDSAGFVTVDGEGSETIDGATTKTLCDRYDFITVYCDGSAWHVTEIGGTTVSQVRSDTGNNSTSHGTTDTKVRRITNHTTLGRAITQATSAGNGTTYTINQDGIYSMTYSDFVQTTPSYIGISLNSAALTTNIDSQTAAVRLASERISDTTGNVAATVKLVAGDIIRAHTDAAGTFTTSAICQFIITQIAKI